MSAILVQGRTKEPITQEISSEDMQQVERALIDASARFPVLMFYATGIFWLMVATFFGFISSIKMHHPEFLGNWSWLTFGRVWPAYIDAFAYGWGCLAGMGTSIWLIARLCRVSLRQPGLLVFGLVIWNFGVALGIVGILSGNSQGIEWLEFPGTAAVILFLGYSLIAIWGVIMFRLRRQGHVYISVWYLIGAFFWFPWVYGAANIMLSMVQVQGVMQALVSWWYAQNFIGMWFTSIGLAAIYYLIPKVLGRPIHSYYLALLGFWSFALFSPWTGMRHLIGGPLPVWLVTVGIVATILMIIPVATVTLNYFLTMRGQYRMVYHSPTIRFVFYGAIAYTLMSIAGLVLSLRSVDGITHFTLVGVAHSQLGLYAFFTMVMFGSIYYIVPRLVGCEWLSASLIRIHFWGAAYGISLVIIMLVIAGLAHGAAMADPEVGFIQTIDHTRPYLVARTIGVIMLSFAHAVFALHFLLMLLRLGQPSGKPTLFAPINEEVEL